MCTCGRRSRRPRPRPPRPQDRKSLSERTPSCSRLHPSVRGTRFRGAKAHVCYSGQLTCAGWRCRVAGLRVGTDLFRQLTLMELEMFTQITPADAYYKTGKDTGKGGRRLIELIDHFNKVGLDPEPAGP